MRNKGRKNRIGTWLHSFFPAVLILVFSLTGISGCSSETAIPEESQYYIYYLNVSGKSLVRIPYEMQTDDSDIEGQINEVLDAMAAVPDDEREEAETLLPSDVSMSQCQWENYVVTLDMSASYLDMSTAREVLVREGLVRIFTQLGEIRSVQITVEGEPLTDTSGNEVGPMTEQSFVESGGNNVNAYVGTEMTLYYADEGGTKLVPETRTVYYSSSEPLEYAVVEELIKGPEEAGHYPTISGDLQLLSVLTQDGTCYVNLGRTVSNSVLSVSEEVQVYSIVNSLTRNCSISKVQFSIDGQSDVFFRESMSLDEVYTLNTELIESAAGE